MTRHHPSCRCSQLKLVEQADPVRVTMCHCLACRRGTSSTYGAQVRFATAGVAITGDSTEYARIGDEGGAGHLYEERRHPWVSVPEGARRLD